MKYCRLSTALIVGFFILVLSTTSCSKKQTCLKTSTLTTAEPSLSIARLMDVPIPLGFTLFYQENSSETFMLQFQGNKSIESSTTFYLQEMDRLGWDLKNFSTQTHSLLFGEKGQRHCIINITQQGKAIITLHINKKQKKRPGGSLDINKKQLEAAYNT